MGNTDHAKIVIPYSPRWFQRKVHEEMRRFNVLVFHRRAGKTVLAMNHLIKKIIKCPLPNAQGHYIAPFRGQVKRIAWKYLQEFTKPIPGMDYNKSDLIARFPNGDQIELLGADNFDALRGVYSDEAVLDEYAQMHPALWGEIFRPALADRKGGATFIGTPKGHNIFYDKWEQAGREPGWYRAMYRVNETGALDIEEILAARREMSDEEFDQEFMCSWSAAIRGAYYGKEMQALEGEGKIMSVPHDPSLPTVTSWDLGMRDLTTIFYWQTAGRETRLIDVDATEGVGIAGLVKVVNSKPYNYSKHIMPHDVRVRELGTGKSRLEVFAKLGLQCAIAPNLPIVDGISAVRNLLPRCVIDSQKCKVAIEALKLYRTEYDDRKQVYKNTPLHDWTSHYADNARIYAVTDHRSKNERWQSELDYSTADRLAV